MINIVIIAVCIIAGMLFKSSKTLPADSYKAINAWLIYIALPAVSFKYLPHITWGKELLLPALSPVIVWLGAWAYIKTYGSRRNIPRSTEGAMRLTAGLSNTSFVGFPLIMAYFSEKDLGIAIICDQVTFTLLCFAGVLVAINSSGKHTLTTSLLVKKLCSFPPFLACIGALTLPYFIPLSPLEPLFDKLATTVAPLALFSVGLQLKFEGWREEIKNIQVALLHKLLIAPALVFAFAFIMKIKGPFAQISIFEAAMPTLVTSGIVAGEYNINPRLTNLIIGISIVVAFATTALWFLLLKNL